MLSVYNWDISKGVEVAEGGGKIRWCHKCKMYGNLTNKQINMIMDKLKQPFNTFLNRKKQIPWTTSSWK